MGKHDKHITNETKDTWRAGKSIFKYIEQGQFHCYIKYVQINLKLKTRNPQKEEMVKGQ